MNSTKSEKSNKATNSSVQSDNKSLHLCYWNMYGLSDEKSSIISTDLSKFDLCVLSETFNTKDRMIDIEGFVTIEHLVRAYQNPKALRGSGGMSIFLNKKSNLKVVIVITLEMIILTNCTRMLYTLRMSMIYF